MKMHGKSVVGIAAIVVGFGCSSSEGESESESQEELEAEVSADDSTGSNVATAVLESLAAAVATVDDTEEGLGSAAERRYGNGNCPLVETSAPSILLSYESCTNGRSGSITLIRVAEGSWTITVDDFSNTHATGAYQQGDVTEPCESARDTRADATLVDPPAAKDEGQHSEIVYNGTLTAERVRRDPGAWTVNGSITAEVVFEGIATNECNWSGDLQSSELLCAITYDIRTEQDDPAELSFQDFLVTIDGLAGTEVMDGSVGLALALQGQYGSYVILPGIGERATCRDTLPEIDQTLTFSTLEYPRPALCSCASSGSATAGNSHVSIGARYGVSDYTVSCGAVTFDFGAAHLEASPCGSDAVTVSYEGAEVSPAPPEAAADTVQAIGDTLCNALERAASRVATNFCGEI